MTAFIQEGTLIFAWTLQKSKELQLLVEQTYEHSSKHMLVTYCG